MPRMLRRAAVLGATAHVASHRGAAKAQQQAAQQETVAAPEQEAAVPEQVAPPVAEAAAATANTYGDLMKLKELLDAGALTQAEFDAEKQKILAS
jgi:hypothetical protein